MSRCSSPSRGSRGFTLLEIVAVVALIGFMMALVPFNMDSWGSRSRLESGANSLVAAIASARAQAIYDGYDAYLEIGQGRNDPDDELRPAFRIRYTSTPAATEEFGVDEREAERLREIREREREWLVTAWRMMPKNIELLGVSSAKGNWNKPSGERPFSLGFTAEGNVAHALAIRIEAPDLDVRREFRTATIMVNALTSLASWQEGEHELPERRPAAEFQR